jgi:ATP-dependent RNA helicase DeaD
MPSFQDFVLQPATRAALANMEISEPTPIQAAAIPALLAGSDLVGQSATGSGKTLAYGIPLIERLARDKRSVQALVLLPTRELAVQVSAVLARLSAGRRLSIALLVGGRPYGNQISALRYGSQIVVGTPGRVKDHLERGTLVLSQLRMCILDEADQMLDSGFAPVIEEILATTPDTRQMALFSATMPDWVAKLQKKFLKDPVKVDITAAMGGQSTIEQIAYQVPQAQKMAALCTLLLSAKGESSLIFGRTKFGVEKLGKQLSSLGFAVGTLHGNKSQRAREDVLSAFRRGQVHTLLATNVAARGLDIQGIYQVINYELPESSDLFTHRIGRTGRMGQAGKAITLLVPADLPKWRRMAQNLGQTVALQKLAINAEAATPTPLTAPVALFAEQEPGESQRPPVRERRSFGADREQQFEGQRPFRERRSFGADREQQFEGQRPFRERKPFVADRDREQFEGQRPFRERKPFGADREREQVEGQRPFRERKPFVAEREQMEGQRPFRERKPFVADRDREPGEGQRPVRVRTRSAADQERENLEAQRLIRGRKSVIAAQEQASETVSEVKKVPQAPATGGMQTRRPAWHPEGFVAPERPASGGRRGAGKPSGFGRTAGKRRAPAFGTPEAQSRPAGRKPRATTAPAGRKAASNQSASR